MADFSIELQHKNHVIAGIDEVGRGALAGPVVVGAVIIKDQSCCEGIKDSKQVPRNKRKVLSDMIWAKHHCAIGAASIDEINSLPLNQAIFLAMTRAYDALQLKPTLLLVDGDYKFSFPTQSLNVIRGDQISVSIAAASIIAKVYRDELMIELSKSHPDYLWNKNMGYGTAEHLSGIEKNGVSVHHRLSFCPIKSLKL